MKKPSKRAIRKWFYKNVDSFSVCYDAGHIDYSALAKKTTFSTYGVTGEVNKRIWEEYGSDPHLLFWWARQNKGKHFGGYWCSELTIKYTLKSKAKERVDFEKSLIK